MTACIVCKEPTTDTLGGSPKHLTREGCVAALREKEKRMVPLLPPRVPHIAPDTTHDACEAEIAVLRERVERVETAARDVYECAGIEMDDARLRYIVIQLDRGDWQALGAALLAPTPAAP